MRTRRNISPISLASSFSLDGEFRQLALGIRDGRFHGRSADQGHYRAELQAARPLALANAFPCRPAKVRKEAVGQVDARIGQGRGPRSLRHARYPRDGTGDAVDGVVQHFGRQSPGDRVRIVDLVVVVPAIGLDRKLIGPRAADQPQHVPHVEMMVDELPRQVIEQFRVGGRIAGADVVQRLDDARRPAGIPRAG